MNLLPTGEKRRPQEIAGFDFSSSGVKVVRLRFANSQWSLLAADILPASVREDGTLARPAISKALMTNYAAIAYSASACVVRVVAHTISHSQTDVERQVRDQIGLDTSYRLSFIPTGQVTKGRNENRVLAVAIPDQEAVDILGTFADGAPAPYSLEVAGLASLNAALAGPVARAPEVPACLLDCGSRVSTIVFVHKGAIILARKLDVGGDAVVDRVQKNLGVDREMAENIMSEGAIDISQSVREVIDPFLRQMMISRDYVERQENCRVTTVWITGGMSMSAYWVNEIRKATGMNVQSWNPLEDLQVAGGALPQKFQGQESRFAAAIGAAKGALSES